MENLIPIIIFLIIFFITVIKHTQKNQPQGKNKGLVDRINDYLTDLQKKMEQQSRTGSSGGFGWDDLIDGQEKVHAREDSLNDQEMIETQEPPPPPAPARAKTDYPREKKPDRKPVPEIISDTGIPPRRSVAAGIAGNRARLRRAVVWSEILGPPVGLRNPDENRR